MDNLFKEYGYTNDPRKSTKPSSIILVNLIAPKIEYQSYGKGRINERPFANEIAELAYKMCYGGGNKAYVTFEGKKVTGIGEVRALLLQRNKDIIANPELKETDRWTQATVFYRTRKILKDKGSRELKRASIISYIDDIRRDELKKPREQLGIYAADRAQMYFKGRTFDVGFDEIKNC